MGSSSIFLWADGIEGVFSRIEHKEAQFERRRLPGDKSDPNCVLVWRLEVKNRR
jgi:hypothetical protein